MSIVSVMSFIGECFSAQSIRCSLRASTRWLVPVLVLGATLLAGGSTAHAAPFAYLADRVTTTISVVDMASYLTIATTPLGPSSTQPINVVANKATNKIYLGKASSIAIMDAVSNTLIGDIALGTGPLLYTFGTESQSLVVANNGKKAYALTAGLVSVIDLTTKAVVATIAVPAAASGMALDEDGETLYVSTGNFSATATPAIVIIDTLINAIDSVVSTGTLVPLHLAMHPDDNHLYVVGFHNDSASNLNYAVLDPATATLATVAVTLPPGVPHIGQFNNFVFNADGSRLYLAPQTLDMTTIPVLEVNTLTGSVTRVLSVPSGFADQHDFVKMAAGFAGGKFTLAFYIAEHLHHYPSEPPRRVVFVDGISGAVVKQLVFPSPFNNNAIVGDILDVAAKPLSGKIHTITTLQASTSPPLRPNIPLTLRATTATSTSTTATGTGANPSGNVVFQFSDPPQTAVSQSLQTATINVRRTLVNGTATLVLPACTARWNNLSLRRVVCSNQFAVAARYRGDTLHRSSASAVLAETR